MRFARYPGRMGKQFLFVVGIYTVAVVATSQISKELNETFNPEALNGLRFDFGDKWIGIMDLSYPYEGDQLYEMLFNRETVPVMRISELSMFYKKSFENVPVLVIYYNVAVFKVSRSGLEGGLVKCKMLHILFG